MAIGGGVQEQSITSAAEELSQVEDEDDFTDDLTVSTFVEDV